MFLSRKKSYCLVVVNGLLFWCGASGIAQIGTARVNACSKAGRLLMKGPYVSIKYHCELEGFYFSPLIVLLTVHTVSLTFLTTLLAPNKKGWERGGGKEEGAGGGGYPCPLTRILHRCHAWRWPAIQPEADSATSRVCYKCIKLRDESRLSFTLRTQSTWNQNPREATRALLGWKMRKQPICGP